MILVGIDPSFTGTGIAMWNGGDIIRTEKLSTTLEGKRFIDIAKGARDITNKVTSLVSCQDLDGIQILSECPPPAGQFASGLYGLDVQLLLSLCNIPDVVSVDVVNPNYLQHLHKKRVYAKSESVSLAKEWVAKAGLSISSKARFSADEAEATLFLMRLFVRNATCRVVESMPEQLRDKKELNLYTRRKHG